MVQPINIDLSSYNRYYLNKNIGFAYRRLSIIDIESSRQPLPTSDKDYWKTYNGALNKYLVIKPRIRKICKIQKNHDLVLHLPWLHKKI